MWTTSPACRDFRHSWSNARLMQAGQACPACARNDDTVRFNWDIGEVGRMDVAFGVKWRRPRNPQGFRGHMERNTGFEPGDLRLGKASSVSHQPSPLLTNGPQSLKFLQTMSGLRTGQLTNRPRPCTAVLFPRCSKTARGRSTSRRSPCSSAGRGMQCAPPATEGSWYTAGTT